MFYHDVRALNATSISNRVICWKKNRLSISYDRDGKKSCDYMLKRRLREPTFGFIFSIFFVSLITVIVLTSVTFRV